MPIYSSTGEVYEDEEQFLMNVPSPQDNKGLTQKEFNQRFHANERGRDGWYEMPGDVSGHYKNLDENYASIPSAVYSRMDKFLKDNNYKINEEKWSEFIATQRRSENIEDARDPLEVEYDRMMREEPTQTYERKLEEIPLQSGAAPAPQNAPQIDSKPRTDVSSTAPVPQVGGDVDPNQIGQTETRSGAERYQLWPEKMVRDFATKFSNSKQFLDLYLEGKVAYDDPNLVNAITTIASTAGGLGLATAPLRTGSAGTFGGALGGYNKSYNLFMDEVIKSGRSTETGLVSNPKTGFYETKFKDPKVQEVFDMFKDDFGKGTIDRLVKAGLPDNEVTRLTGWFKDPRDSQWKFEIPDKDAKLDVAHLKQVKEYGDDPDNSLGASMTKLGSLLEHEQLYSIYPELSDYKVIYQKELAQNPTAIAAFAESMRTVIITDKFMKQPKEEQVSTLLHEIQHGLQAIEGFARGGSKHNTPSGIKAAELDAFLTKGSDKVREIREKGSAATLEEKRKANEFLALSYKGYEKLKELQDKSFQEYLNLGGEIESREVQRRYEKAINYKQKDEDWMIDNIDDSFWR